MPTLTEHTEALLARILRRLPQSLWDTDPASDTLQRDLARAMAAQCAIWLENREIARQSTLLREAAGVDLDTLLADYGLKRYLQRPDDYARQIALQILWTPKGTLYAVDTLADLLFDVPHLTLITGRSHVHVLLTDTHPITVPYSYWGMLSQDGVWYALTVHGTVPTLLPFPPPGVDLSPGERPLHWFTVQDEIAADWYVAIQGDTLVTSQMPPTWGNGTEEPLSVLDGYGTTWGFSVQSLTGVLISTPTATDQPDLPVLTPTHPFQAVQFVDSFASTWWLSIDAATAQLTSTLPAGATDGTPSGGPFRWLRVRDLAGTAWYASPTRLGLWSLDATPPSGVGTALPQGLGDDENVLWHWGVSAGTFALSDAPHIDYGGMATAICLNDAQGNRWFWRVRGGRLEWSAQLWPDTIDQSPWGELGWLFMPTTTGAMVYVYPSLQGVPVAAPGPPASSPWGWSDPVILVDSSGTRWQMQVTPSTPGFIDYWRLYDASNVLHYLWVDTEVPMTDVSPPALGVDQFPADAPFDWLTVLDAAARPWYVALRDGVLLVTSTVPTTSVSPLLQVAQDVFGTFWSLQMSRVPDVLVTRAAGPWRVGVSQVDTVHIPSATAPIAMRDVMDAIGHVQAAGSLVTVLIT